MNNKTETVSKSVISKKQWVLFLAGLILLMTGLSVLGFFGIRKIYREYQKQKMLAANIVLEYPRLHIKAPVLEGTDNEILAKATGHFENTGSVGTGNFCIAGHSSVIYKEYFNNLKKSETGDEIFLYDMQKNKYIYVVSDIFIVNPDETWILHDFDDTRITIVTCTDDGTQRLVVVGKLSSDESNQEAFNS